MKKWIWVVLVALLAWNVWLSVEVLKPAQEETVTPSDKEETSETIINKTEVTDYTTELTETIGNARASIVSVETNGNNNQSRSGIIFANEDSDTYIFTSLEGVSLESEVDVIFDNGVRTKAEVVGNDEGTKLTLLKVEVSFTVNPLRTGDSDLVEQGEYVIAVGGRGASNGIGPVSFGIVSQPGQLRIGTDPWYANVIETDALVSDSLWGGAILGVGGELMGIMIPNGSSAMGYGISSNEAKLVYKELMEGSITRGALDVVGRNVSDLRSYEKSALGIPLDQTDGVLVTYIQKPIEEGLQVGDIILNIAYKDIENLSSLRSELYDLEAQTMAPVRILREGEPLEIEVELQ